MSDVRFYSRSSIRFARCDCIEGTLCEHVVLAVQAFVEAKTQQAEFTHLIWQMRSEHVTSSDDPFASEEGKTCRQYVQQLSQALGRDKSTANPLRGRFQSRATSGGTLQLAMGE